MKKNLVVVGYGGMVLDWGVHLIDQPASDVHDYYRNFCKTIDGEATQIVTHPQMRKVMKVMEACFESDRLGQPVKFAE